MTIPQHQLALIYLCNVLLPQISKIVEWLRGRDEEVHLISLQPHHRTTSPSEGLILSFSCQTIINGPHDAYLPTQLPTYFTLIRRVPSPYIPSSNSSTPGQSLAQKLYKKATN